MDWNLNRLLKLPNMIIIKVQEIEDMICLHLESIKDGINCPNCGKYTDNIHQTRSVLVRDLSICGNGVYLKIPRRQFVCEECGKYTTEKIEEIEFNRHHTKRYEEYVYERVLATTVRQVCREEKLKADEIQAIFDAVSEEKREEKWLSIKRVGLDEMSTGKGQKKYRGMVSDLDKKSLIEVVKDRTQEILIESLMVQPRAIREKVEEVCVDMWGGFEKVIKEVFPNAITVYDHFHVIQMVNKKLNKIRYKLGIKNRGIRHLLLSNRENLTKEEKEELSMIFHDTPILQIAYEIKEELRQIYQRTRTISGGTRKMRSWLRIAEIFYGEICTTIRQHLEGICNYFIHRTTNAVMEGLNNRSRVILRQTYGLGNFEHLRSRLLGANH
jgi:transposase